MSATIEIWKDIEGYEGLYQVSNHGRVKSLDRFKNGYNYKGKILKPGSGKKKYQHFILCAKEGRGIKSYLGHRLVANAFIDNPNQYKVVNHKDSNPENNNVTNLEWCTHLQNVQHGHAFGFGYKRVGSNNYQAKLTEQDVRDIIAMSKHMRTIDIVNQYGVAYQTIHKILKGASWNQVTGLPRVRYYKNKTAA